MVHIAGIMEREGMTTPLLIGGATTSRLHTAVKIAPGYSQPVVHVADASRAVGVAGALVDERTRPAFFANLREEYETVRREREGRASKVTRLPIADARANRLRLDFVAAPPPVPTFLGVRTFEDYPLAELVDRIDWTPFFETWELRGSYPAILSDGLVGAAARELHADACTLLDRIVGERLLRASAVVGFWPANATEDDDIVLWADETRTTEAGRLHALRQQMAKAAGRPNVSVADFVAPVGVADYVGAFAVTTGHGIDDLVHGFEAAHDDYSAIMTKALADRLAEAFAERMHERVRRELWGYAPDEALPNEDLIAERYQGIRPAPGYPATPDHLAKRTLFSLLDAEARAGHPPHGVDGDAAGRLGLGDLPVAPGVPLLRRRTDGQGPARGLRASSGIAGRRGSPLARPEPRRRVAPPSSPARGSVRPPACRSPARLRPARRRSARPPRHRQRNHPSTCPIGEISDCQSANPQIPTPIRVFVAWDARIRPGWPLIGGFNAYGAASAGRRGRAGSQWPRPGAKDGADDRGLSRGRERAENPS